MANVRCLPLVVVSRKNMLLSTTIGRKKEEKLRVRGPEAQQTAKVTKVLEFSSAEMVPVHWS